MRQQLDTYGHGLVKIGDVVYIRAVVQQVDTENLLVELFSKTDQYEVWVRPGNCELDLPDLPAEPADGTVLAGKAADGTPHVFRRDDVGSSDHAVRRFPRNWWSYVDQTWVDWPYVVTHGGRDAQVLVPAGSGPVDSGDPLDALGISQREKDQITNVLEGCTHPGRTLSMISKTVYRRASSETLRILAGEDVDGLTVPGAVRIIAGRLEEHLRWRCDRGEMQQSRGAGYSVDRWIWIKLNA